MFNTTRKVVTFNWPICVSFFCEFVFNVCKRKLLEEVEGVRCSVVGSYHYTSSYGYFISLGTQFCNKQAIYFPSYLCQQKGWPAATKNKEEAEKEKKKKFFFWSKIQKYHWTYKCSEIEALFSLIFRVYFIVSEQAIAIQ